MKKHNFTLSGGFPVTQKPFKKIQEAYLQGIDALIHYLEIPGSGNYIISGCELVGGSYSFGWMVIDGELMRYGGGAEAHVKVITVTETETFEDVSVNVVYTDKYTQSNVEEPGVTIPIADFIRFTNVTAYGAITTDHTVTGGFRKERDMVKLFGSVLRGGGVSIVSTNAVTKVCNISGSENWPAFDRYYTTAVIISGEPVIRYIKIATNGDVSIFGAFASGDRIFFDSISYQV